VLAETVDIYPTLCELAGLPAPKNPQPLEGKSLVPVLKKPSRQSKKAIFHVYPRSRKGDGAILGRAVRTGRYRLVEWKKPGAAAETAEFELYDYESDPSETKNSRRNNLVVKNSAPADGAARSPPADSPSKTNATSKQDRTALFERKDANHDGRLTRAEFWQIN
jgi:iduronate 2-sulfatase